MSLPQLQVFVAGRLVATLSSDDGFAHHLTYHPEAREEDFVSLVMPVRPASWSWPALHPFFQMNLPEGYLLSVLKEQLGPHLGSRPLDLLAVVGHNMIGRVQLAVGAAPRRADSAVDLEALLHGEHSMEAFMTLMRENAASGVSGVVPKFLSPQTRALFRKGSMATERHIVKASSDRLPFLALNEHLAMRAAARTGAATARTRVSQDGQVLLVERFDLAADGGRLGFEDCCSLLGLGAEDKYNSTWERLARLAHEFLSPENLAPGREQLALKLLLTYALGNADCHTKSLALLYSSAHDVRMAPIYGMLTVLAYDHHAANPPGLFVGGRKSWDPGNALRLYLQQSLGFDPPKQRELIDRVCSAVTDTVPELLQHARHTPGFGAVASRMAHAWATGLARLATRASIVVADLTQSAREGGLEPIPVNRPAPHRIGQSEPLGRRGRTRRPF